MYYITINLLASDKKTLNQIISILVNEYNLIYNEHTSVLFNSDFIDLETNNHVGVFFSYEFKINQQIKKLIDDREDRKKYEMRKAQKLELRMEK